MSEELLPCPFCGSKPKLLIDLAIHKYYVCCLDSRCWAEGGVQETAEKAIECWNTRTDEVRTHETAADWWHPDCWQNATSRAMVEVEVARLTGADIAGLRKVFDAYAQLLES